MGRYQSSGWRTQRGLNPEQTGGRMLGFLCHCDLQSVVQSTIKVGVRYLEIKDMQFTIANEYCSKAYETSGREHPVKKERSLKAKP